MPTQDIRSDLDSRVLLSGVISTNTTTVGSIMDTAAYDLGIMLTVLCAAFTDGVYTLLLEESDDSGMADATVVGAEKLIGALPSLTAATNVNTSAATVGFFSTKRYVRASIVSTGVTTGASLLVHAVSKAENMATSAVGNTGIIE